MDATELLEQNTDSNRYFRKFPSPYVHYHRYIKDRELLLESLERKIAMSRYHTGRARCLPSYRSRLACEGRDIVITVRYTKRSPSLDEVSLYLWLWSSEKRMKFFIDATALLKQTDSSRNLLNEMKKVKWDYCARYKWKSGVLSEFFEQWKKMSWKKMSWYNTYNRWCLFQTSRSPWACEAIYIAYKLQFGKRPPSLDKVSIHPLLWSSKKRIQFFMDLTKVFERVDCYDFFQVLSRVRSQMSPYITYERDYYACFKPNSRVPSKLFKQWKKVSQYITYECDDYACFEPESRMLSELFKLLIIMSQYITYERHYYACFKPKSRVPSELFEQWKKMSWYNTCHPWCLLQTSRSPWACEARDIAHKLQFGKRPPSLDKVSLHPFLWSSEKRIQFFMDATALLEQMIDSNRNLCNEMQKVKWDYYACYKWKSIVPSEMFEYLAPSILDLPEDVFSDTKSSFERIINLSILETLEESAPSISDVPIGLLSDILSLTSPVDACRAAAVSNIFKAVADSDYVWHKFLPLDLHEIIARAVSNVVFHSQKELYFLLSDSYILLDRGTLGFKLDKESGKKCYMLAARHLSIAWHDDKRYWEWGHMPESRFAEVGMLKEVRCLDIHGIITTAMLSPKTMYVANLVFLTTRWSSGLNVPAKTIVTVGGIRNETSNVYLQRPGTKAQPQVSHTMRKDGWMEIPLGEFYCDDGDEGEVKMVFEELVYWKAGLIVEGIEVRPK